MAKVDATVGKRLTYAGLIDVVLRYKPKPKSDAAKARKRKYRVLHSVNSN